jgi:Na+/proline symporter
MHDPHVIWVELGIFIALFLLVALLGFAAARRRKAQSLAQLDEWGLGGRGFGAFIGWFLLGGDLYTAYAFIAVPALMYGTGAIGFFAVPYTIIVYPLVFLIMPRLWSVAHRHGAVTPSDFIRVRYGSSILALAIALTGIVATMPYIAGDLHPEQAGRLRAHLRRGAGPLRDAEGQEGRRGVHPSGRGPDGVLDARARVGLRAVHVPPLDHGRALDQGSKRDPAQRRPAAGLQLPVSINLQLLGGVWILQTFPAIVFGLYTRYFHRWALLLGWAAGMVTGTLMAYAVPNPAKHQHHFGGSVYSWHYFGLHFKAYHGLIALVINLIVVIVASVVLNAVRAPRGEDRTAAKDYEVVGAPPLPEPVGEGAVPAM